MRLTKLVYSSPQLSRSALDLPYIYSTEGKIKEPNLLAEAGQGLMSAGVSYLKGDVGGMVSGLMGLGKQMMNSSSGAAEKAKQYVPIYKTCEGVQVADSRGTQNQDQSGGRGVVVGL